MRLASVVLGVLCLVGTAWAGPSVDALKPTLRLAGFALAHAAWSVDDGDTLLTLAMYEVGGKRSLLRAEGDTIPASVESAHRQLLRLKPDRYALVWDTYLHMRSHYSSADTRTDALLVEVFDRALAWKAGIALAYQKKTPSQAFALLGDIELLPAAAVEEKIAPGHQGSGVDSLDAAFARQARQSIEAGMREHTAAMKAITWKR